MNICNKCSGYFEPQKGLKNYCSLSCRNSRKWTESDNQLKSDSAKKSEKVKIANSKNREKVDWEKVKEKRKELFNNKLLGEDFETLSFERLRKRVILEQNNKCNKCGLDKWFDKELSLEIDHIDGDNTNNVRENLEGLCPNCHSITPTWRGRNKKNKRCLITDEELFNSLLKNEWNFRKSLLEFNLAAKGGNYKRCHRLKREYEELNNLP